MLYFSPLSVTDDKQRDRNHPSSSSYSAGRVVLGDLVDVAACGSKIVLCISERIYTLRGGEDGCEQMCTLHAVFVLWGGWGILCGPREVNAAFYYEFGL